MDPDKWFASFGAPNPRSHPAPAVSLPGPQDSGKHDPGSRREEGPQTAPEPADMPADDDMVLAQQAPPVAAPAPAAQVSEHKVWLTVWWPDAPVDVEDATAATLPEGLPDHVFGAIPESLRPAVAYAVLKEHVARYTDPRRTRDAIGFSLPGGDWAMAVPVAVSSPERSDLVAVFVTGVDPDTGYPNMYRFSSWVSPSDGAELVAVSHDTPPAWAPGN